MVSYSDDTAEFFFTGEPRLRRVGYTNRATSSIDGCKACGAERLVFRTIAPNENGEMGWVYGCEACGVTTFYSDEQVADAVADIHEERKRAENPERY